MFFESSMAAGILAGVSVTLAFLVLADFITFAYNRYKERYLKEAAVELDDVLLQIPAGRILDVSLAISMIAAFLTITIFASASDNFSWSKAIFLGIVAAIFAFPVPRLFLKHLKKQRLIKFNEQLEDALGSMSSALKAGFSINQAIESVATENKRPISIEFRLLMQEIRLGVSLERALDNLSKRMGSDDFELVATAIITARQTGGELTTIFDRLAGLIRERARINGKLRAMTAQGKLQATIIGIMPVLLLFMMSYVAPAAMDAFFNSIIGIISIIVAAVLIIAGFLMIRKITTIDI
jgi:tight adherence protein B